MTTLPRPSTDDVLDLVRKALDRDDVGAAIAALDLLKEQVDVHDVFDELDVDDQAAMLPAKRCRLIERQVIYLDHFRG